MHRFDEQLMLREAYRKRQTNEGRAAREHALRERRRSLPSIRLSDGAYRTHLGAGRSARAWKLSNTPRAQRS